MPQPLAAVTAEESVTFRAAVQDVTPLQVSPRAEHPRVLPRPVAHRRTADERPALADSLSDHSPWENPPESDEALCFLRPGLSPQILRRLRRGHWGIQAELDLHGLTVDEARGQLAQFLAESTQLGLRCVRIIHGKGHGSPQREPVLKGRVRAWLMQRDEVLAFCQARAADGGSGAAIALLRAT
ncbi:MAG: Smr/MutS family protein [Betaproteobacteria bacterium]|nr:Smr/MutS family protein [Betaproteobacteria bacterium]